MHREQCQYSSQSTFITHSVGPVILSQLSEVTATLGHMWKAIVSQSGNHNGRWLSTCSHKHLPAGQKGQCGQHRNHPFCMERGNFNIKDLLCGNGPWVGQRTPLEGSVPTASFGFRNHQTSWQAVYPLGNLANPVCPGWFQLENLDLLLSEDLTLYSWLSWDLIINQAGLELTGMCSLLCPECSD